MKEFTAVVERDQETGLLVGSIPGVPGAHTQAESMEELVVNLQEVMAMLQEDDHVTLESAFVGTQRIVVA